MTRPKRQKPKTAAYSGSESDIDFLSDTPESEVPINLKEILLLMKKLTSQVVTDEGHKLSLKSTSNLDKLLSHISKALRREKQLATNIERQEKLISDLKIQLNTLKDSTQDAVLGRSAIQAVTSNVMDSIAAVLPKITRKGYEDLMQQIFSCNDRISELTSTLQGVMATVALANSQEQPEDNQEEKTEASQKQVPLSGPANKRQNDVSEDHRTLVVKPNSVTSGEKLLQELHQFPVLSTARVKKVYRRAKHVEIVCATRSDKDVLKRNLQQHQNLNRLATYVDKEPVLQKIVLINVPDYVSKENVMEALADEFHLNDDIFQNVSLIKCKKENHHNWTVLVPLLTAKEMVYEGAFFIGLRKCIIRPYTTVPRCRKCQLLGHSTSTCNSVAACGKCCGMNHAEEACDSAPHCANCSNANKKDVGKRDTSHDPSDPKCSAYQEFFSRKRKKIDELLPSRYNQITRAQESKSNKQSHENPKNPNKSVSYKKSVDHNPKIVQKEHPTPTVAEETRQQATPAGPWYPTTYGFPFPGFAWNAPQVGRMQHPFFPDQAPPGYGHFTSPPVQGQAS